MSPAGEHRLPTAQAAATPDDRTRARLWLTDASRLVLRNGLRLLGVSAPERM